MPRPLRSSSSSTTPPSGGEDGAGAAGDGVGDREVTVLVGVGEQQEIRDVDSCR